LVGLGKGLKAFAASKGHELLVADPNNNSTTQVQQRLTWIKLSRVKAAWVLALNPKTMTPVISAAKAKHVGLLTTGVPSDYGMSAPGPGLSFSIIDYSKFGAAVGKTLGESINSRLGGKAQVLKIDNPAGATGLAEQSRGFLAALEETAPGTRIVATVSSENDRLKAQQNALSAIQGHPGINFDVAERVAVLNRGQKVADVAVKDTGNDEVVGWITGARPPQPELRAAL
jgi:ABC-type sugar transport system substrate-binding protein